MSAPTISRLELIEAIATIREADLPDIAAALERRKTRAWLIEEAGRLPVQWGVEFTEADESDGVRYGARWTLGESTAVRVFVHTDTQEAHALAILGDIIRAISDGALRSPAARGVPLDDIPY